MAAPVYGKGFLANAVIVPESAYGTLAASGQKSLPIVSETLTRNFEYLQNNVKSGYGAAALHSFKGSETVSGTVVCEMDYGNMEELFTCAVGSKAISPTTYSMTDEVTTSYSIILDKTVERFEFTGGFVEEMRIISKAKEISTIETDWVFQKCTPSATAILSDTLTASTKALHSQIVFWIGDISNALVTGDLLAITDFTLRLKNNLRTDVFASGSAYIIQPIRNIPREVTLEFNCPAYSDNEVITAVKGALRAHSQLQSIIVWDGPTTNAITINIPELFGTEPDNVNISGQEVLTFNAKLRAYKNVHNTTHMTAPLDEFNVLTVTT